MSDKQAPDHGPDIAAMSFEEALRELDSIVSQLDGGNVDLEKSIALYERGARLKAHCETKLAEADERIQQITLDGDGNPKGVQAFEA